MKQANFEKSLKLPKLVLGWAGIQIFPKIQNSDVVNFINSWIFYFNLSVLSVMLLGELYWLIEGIYKGQRVEELFICVSCFVIGVLAISKFNCLYFNRDIVQDVVEKLKIIHPIDDEKYLDDANEETMTIKNTLKFLNTVILFSLYLNMVAVIMFGAASILSMVYDFITTGHIVLNLPFRIKYFFEVSTLTRWVPLYLHQVAAMVIASINLVSTDILFYAFCTYLRMHFQLLCLHLEKIVSKNSKVETRKNFRKVVRRHQELIKLVEQIELLYSKSTLCNIILSSLLICLSGFIITSVGDVSVVTPFLTFLPMILTQISLLCFFGDMLNSASTEVSRAAYNSLWYDAELDIRKSLLFVIVRAQKPCKITAMKFADLNLNALSVILRTSWSYFTILKTMYD